MEKFDIYDAHQSKTGRIGRRGVPLEKHEFRIVVTVLIFNHQGELLIQKRQKDKIGFPGYWDYSASGQVITGEEPWQGAQREVSEELGIKIDLSQTPYRFSHSFNEGWDLFYFVTKDIEIEQLRIQTSEVAECRWVNESEYVDLVEKGLFIPYLFARQIVDFYNFSGGHS